MKKAKGAGGGLTKRCTKQSPNLSYNILDVPLELWENIARLSSRQSVACLCSLSHAFYSVFSALLYSNLIDPPLTAFQSSRLIQLLSDGPAAAWKPHPAALIRQLRLTADGFPNSQTIKAETASSSKALSALALGSTARGSALRALHWNLTAGIDELGKILGAPRNFPNLKELFVSSKGFNTNFNFVQIRGLEVLGLDLDLSVHEMREDYGEIGNKLCYRLAEAIQMLPSSSPLLHTLHLNLEIPLNNVGDCPWSGHHDLIADINQIHLPALVTLDLSVNLDSTDEEFVDPNFPTTTNFFPFLNSHPHLLHLTLDVPGTKLENDLTFLPCLRSFTGSFKDAAIICDHPRQLDELVLKLVQRHTYDFPEFRTLPLRTHLSLTKLHVQALDADGKVVKMMNELSPTSLAQLVSSFPNLTHLDICIHGRIPQYRESLILLTKLQSLRIQLYKINQEDPYDSYMWDDLDNIPDPNAPVHKIFPPSDYIRQFDDVVPSLPQLAHIEIFLLADNVELYDDDCEMLFEPPQMRGTYYFCVRGGKVVLERATSTRKRRKTVGVVRR